MIFAFARDSTVLVLDSIEEANIYCEAIDVQNKEYIFIDERDYLLIPIIATSPRQRFLWFFFIIRTVPFGLGPSEERRDDLIRKFEKGEIVFSKRGSEKHSLAELRKIVPSFFSRSKTA